MLSIFKSTELPRTEPQILEFIWLNALHEAKGGNDDSATIMLAGLAWHLQQDTLTKHQRIFLSDALAATADATPGPDRVRAVKEHLLLGRRPGGKPKYVAEGQELRRAMNMWMLVGDVPDADVNAACEYVLGLRSADAPDIKALKKAYLKHRPRLREVWPVQARNSE